jgi:hypothetical protein
VSARDELEAVIWRQVSLMGRRTVTANDAVDAILDAADAYAVAVEHATEDTALVTARRRAVLAEATRDLYMESQHRWRAS